MPTSVPVFIPHYFHTLHNSDTCVFLLPHLFGILCFFQSSFQSELFSSVSHWPTASSSGYIDCFALLRSHICWYGISSEQTLWIGWDFGSRDLAWMKIEGMWPCVASIISDYLRLKGLSSSLKYLNIVQLPCMESDLHIVFVHPCS